MADGDVGADIATECPECGHSIDNHSPGAGCWKLIGCPCSLRPSSIVAARVEAAKAEVRSQVEAALPSPEVFAATRTRIRATYTNAVESGLLLGSVTVEENLANKVRAALDPEEGTSG